jgi:hypothetical protein
MPASWATKRHFGENDSTNPAIREIDRLARTDEPSFALISTSAGDFAREPTPCLMQAIPKASLLLALQGGAAFD